MGHSPNLLGSTTSPGPGGLQPSLQGVKVPDENLTPQQRQHREVQLATIRKMQMILFPQQKEDPTGSLDALPGATSTSSCPPNVPPVSLPNQCPPTMDWHKLQHPFLDGKGKVYINYFILITSGFEILVKIKIIPTGWRRKSRRISSWIGNCWRNASQSRTTTTLSSDNKICKCTNCHSKSKSIFSE